ncbi:beta-lactamase family protein [Parahaliea maris]|uniref:Beta-lactamase family protein n=1 Tax=Parahaliea maris TaxID=2716870 RepID=A0A5C8ZVY4_9GAMM|nr:serine hydrolase [Parahaliea maris]TXS92019.1 beta-lactamase family protein [Parahaliea maris]
MKPGALALVALMALPAVAEDMEAIYQARFKATTANGGYIPEYAPQEPVAGAEQVVPLPVAASGKLTVDEAALDRAEEYARANNSTAFIVWHKGKIQRATYFGDVTAATPLTTMSLSKPMTALAVGRAIKLGYIDSLDQPLSDFFTEWQGTPKASMRVRHLLDMRTGLLPQAYSPDPDHPLNRAYLSPEHGKYIVEEYPLVEAPGSVYGYSNATADLVAVLIERATGQRYGEFLGGEVLAKIGAPGGSQWVNRPGGMAHSGCCAYFPAETYLRMAILLLKGDGIAGEQLLPDGYVKEMRTATPQNPHYGLGLWIGGEYIARRSFAGPHASGPKVLHSEPFVDKDIFMFDGNFNQVVYIEPNFDLIVLRVGKNPPKSPEWDNSFLANTLARAVKDRNPG